MSNNVYKLIEVIGTSENSMEEAVQNAISRAGETVQKMQWFEITETRGRISEGNKILWQVTVKIGFNIVN